jgi:hypothetical protein
MGNTILSNINMLELNHNKLYIDFTKNKILNLVFIIFIIVQIYIMFL